MQWKADNVAGAIFLAPQTAQVDAGQYWEVLATGMLPMAVNRNGPNLQSFASGIYDGFALNVSAQVGRIDIALTALPDASGTFTRIDDVDGAVARIAGYIEVLSSKVSPVRLAIVAELTRPVTNEEQYRALANELTGFPLPPVGSDLNFGLNVRKLGEASGVQFNRLLIWTAGQVGYVSQPLAPVIQTIPATVTFSPYIGLKIDVNTVPERSIANDNIKAILNDIVSETAALAAGGYSRLVA